MAAVEGLALGERSRGAADGDGVLGSYSDVAVDRRLRLDLRANLPGLVGIAVDVHVELSGQVRLVLGIRERGAERDAPDVGAGLVQGDDRLPSRVPGPSGSGRGSLRACQRSRTLASVSAREIVAQVGASSKLQHASGGLRRLD